MANSEYYRGLERAQGALDAAPPDPDRRAAAVHRAMTPLFARTPAAGDRACRAGCDACCHFPVGVTWPEAMRLSAYVAASPALTNRVLAAARASRPLAWAALAGSPCPLLADGECGAYAARPLPCRAMASADADACAAAVHGHANVPIDEIAFARGLGAAAALASDGAPMGTRELRAALAALLTHPPAARAAAFAAARGPDDRDGLE